MKKRPYARYLAIALIVLLLPVFALGTAIAATGTVTVKVKDASPDGISLYLPVPALLVDVALWAAPRVVPEEALAEVRHEIAPYRDRLHALAEEIEAMPAGVLVDVQSAGERVRVTKSWRSFHVDVDTDDTDVHVAVPARLVRRALDVL